MKELSKFFLFVQKVCKKDISIALMFTIIVLDIIGTTAIVFQAKMPFFGIVHFIASVILVILFIAIYGSKDD